MGPKKTNTTATRINDIVIQSSAYGGPITVGWGTFKASANLIWYNAFNAISHVEKQSSGGKGGGSGGSTNTTYTYTASVILGVCAGPISSIRSVYRDQSIFVDGAIGSPTALQQAGLSVATGAVGQSPWGYLTTNYPTQALGYSGLAYTYASDYPLSDSATLPNHSFEVVSTTTVSGLDDANPADILSSFLPMVPLWGTGLISDLTNYGNYCLAANLLLSPVIEQQRQASDFLSEILMASNSEAVWSDGVLKIVPYGDTTVTANGITWNPNLTPIYDLDEGDFIADAEGDEAIQRDLKRPSDAANYVQVEFLDRTRAYAVSTVPAVDQASIDQYGLVKQSSATTAHSICLAVVAATVAQLQVQRTANLRTQYRFNLPWHFCLLEPMDLLTLTSGNMYRQFVRIVSINEADDGEFSVVAEDMLVGTGHAAAVQRQAPGGHVNQFDVAPGNVTAPLMVNPPRALTDGDLEVWIAVAGGVYWGGCEVWVSFDGATYERQGEIDGPARYGVTTADFPVGSDPDTSHTLPVDLTISGGTLTAGSHADADNLSTLCLVGTEIIAYSTATLTAANKYSLSSYIRRGQKGTTIADQASGSEFLRLDQAVFSFPYRDDQVGKTVYVKFLSFNVYLRALQTLDEVDAYTFTLTPSAAVFTVIDWTDIAGKPVAVTDLDTGGAIKGEHITVPSYVGGGARQALTDWTAAALANITTTTALAGVTSGYVSTLQTQVAGALTDLSSKTTQIVQLQSGPAPNILPDPTFSRGFATLSPVRNTGTDWLLSSGGVSGSFAYLNVATGSGYVNGYAGAWVGVSPGSSVVFAADLAISGYTSGSLLIDIEWANSSYVTLSYVSPVGATSASFTRPFVTGAAPTGAAFARARFYVSLTVGTGIAYIRRPKFELGSIPTIYSDDQAQAVAQASVNSEAVTRTANDNALAALITTINATLGPLNSSYTSFAAAQATTNSATSAALTTVQAQILGGTNLVYNSTFALGPSSWTAGVTTAYINPLSADPKTPWAYGRPATGDTGSTYYGATWYQVLPTIYASAPYSFQFEAYTGVIGASHNVCRGYLQFLSSSGSVTGYSNITQIFTSSGWTVYTSPNNIAPAGTTHAILIFDMVATSGNVIGNGDVFGIRHIKVENSAVCTAWTDDAAVPTLQASVSVTQSAIATLNQVYGTYGVSVAAGGVITGITLYSSSGATTYSGIILQADHLQIVPATGVGALQPFYYDSGTGTLALQNLSVYGNLVVGGTLTTGKMANGSISGTSDAYSGGSVTISGATSVQSLGVTTSGGKLHITFSFFLAIASTAYHDQANLTIYDNGTAIYSIPAMQASVPTTGGPSGSYYSNTGLVAGAFSYTPGAGYHDFELYVTPPPSSLSSATVVSARDLTVEELKVPE